MPARHEVYGIGPDDDFGVVAGWFPTLEDLDEARTGTHDTLLKLMGDARVGPVQWLWWTGPDADVALRVIRRDPPSPAHADHYRRLAALLREHGGFLIVAMAPGRRIHPDLAASSSGDPMPALPAAPKENP